MPRVYPELFASPPGSGCGVSHRRRALGTKRRRKITGWRASFLGRGRSLPSSLGLAAGRTTFPGLRVVAASLCRVLGGTPIPRSSDPPPWRSENGNDGLTLPLESEAKPSVEFASRTRAALAQAEELEGGVFLGLRARRAPGHCGEARDANAWAHGPR